MGVECQDYCQASARGCAHPDLLELHTHKYTQEVHPFILILILISFRFFFFQNKRYGVDTIMCRVDVRRSRKDNKRQIETWSHSSAPGRR